MLKKIVVSALLSSVMVYAESGVGLNINETDLEVEAVLDSRNLQALQTSSTIYQADFNFLNVNETSKFVGLGLGATNKVEGLEGVEMTFGAKAIWAELGRDDFTSLPLMGKIRYTFPPLMYNIPPVSLEGKVMYAPKALSFGDSEAYSEFRASASMEVIESVNVVIGYRNIHTEYKKIDTLFDTGFYAGLKFTY